jgi:WD40 repeat protein
MFKRSLFTLLAALSLAGTLTAQADPKPRPTPTPVPTPPPLSILLVEQNYGSIGTYNITTGAVINPNFLICTGTPVVFGDVLFTISGQFTIGKYDAATGTVINSTFITLPYSGTYALAVSGTTLYVSNNATGIISTYDATTGALVNANFITGLYNPRAIAVTNNKLFVANYTSVSDLSEYDATTGTLINLNFGGNNFRTPGWSIAVLGNDLFLPGADGSSPTGNPDGDIAKLDATTGAITQFITGLFSPFGIAISPDNRLFVSNNSNIGEYDATTGTPINANFIIHLSNPTGLVITTLPSPSPTPTPKPKKH